MNILLTGSNGFLGSHILEKLVTSHNVSITLRRNSNLDRIFSLITQKNINILYVDDIAHTEIESFFKNQKIELVIHCATDYGRKNNYFFEVFESNVLFPLKLLEIGLKYNLKYFINTDSYFNKNHLTYNALPNYSKTKKLFLSYLQTVGAGLSIINMRLEHIYGPNDNDDKFIPYLFKNLLLDNEIALTYGHQKRDFVYIDDVVDIYIKIISTLSHKEKPYFIDLEIGSGKSIFLKDFVETMKSITKSSSALKYGMIDYRDDEIMNSFADNSLDQYAQENHIAFQFSTLDQGLEKMLDTYNTEMTNKDSRTHNK